MKSKSKSKSKANALKSLFMIAGLGLAACNDPNQQTLAPDWVHSGNVNTIPSPLPTAQPIPSSAPSPSPIPSGSALYTGPAEVEPFVQKFVADALIRNVNVLSNMDNPKLEIQLADLSAYGSTTIGLCETGGGIRRVTFSPRFWNQVSDTQKELLAHHELGHCVLYRPHKTTLLSSGAYASIMYPIIMSSSTYLNNYDYYQQELFTQGAQAGMAADQVDPSAANIHVCDEHDLGFN